VGTHVEALLQRVLDERDLEGILRALLNQALAATGAPEGAAYWWDAGGQVLQPVGGRPMASLLLGEGVAGLAAKRGCTVTQDDELGVPVRRVEELLGVLWLRGALAAVADVERLAAVAAAAMTWFEAVRLGGALLAARTAEHEVNNRLVATTAYAQLMLRDPAFPPHLRERADSIVKGAREAALIVRKLRELADIQETRWGEDPELTTIDLERSRGRTD
jgi:hypothetical protein